ncbi:SCO family protein [Bacillaceae bacterium S4-13-56]
MNNKLRNRIAIILVLLFGVSIFYVGTDGFRAFTAESARTLSLEKNKPSFPSVTLEDSKYQTYTFQELAKDKYVFITFMYTNCGSVCPILEMNMADVYDLIPEAYLGKDILFLSISFDTERDTPEVLSKYGSYFEIDEDFWRMARIPNEQELQSVLDSLGVIVIPDNNGNFQHNSAFYLINPNGQLEEVMDFTKIEEAARTTQTFLETGRD